ncbi:hypothetical protein [uncultured Stenotrophomonas sp.]|uniref:hypothetical protein n=1 Tax=uncultured Stenotrophomonas sp. TaxID=165438 RepID=UPI0028EC5EF1|nr:hypothetical protein [uncultured Stenotrophomonas sp.]
MYSHTPNTSAAVNAQQKLWWRKPKSVMTNALHHDSLETFPGCPPIPCVKLRGLWIDALGIKPGTRLYVDAQPGVIVLSAQQTAVSQTAVVVKPVRGSAKAVA